MADMAETVVGELIAQSATVLVRGEASCRALHAWPGGAFGELLVHDAQTGAPVSGPPPGAKGHKRRPAGSTVVLLRLRAFEAIWLAFEVKPPRLHIVALPPPTESVAASSTFGAAEEAAAEAAALAPPLDLGTCWAALCAEEPHLAQLYATYVALRKAGWYIRDGLKFGFDLALYDATAPQRQHAPLGALVLTDGDEHERSWLWLQRHARVCHSVGKGLLLCSVETPRGEPASETIPPKLHVRTMRFDGWDPGREHAKLS